MNVLELICETPFESCYRTVDILEVTGEFEMYDDLVEEATSHPLYKHIRSGVPTRFFNYDEIQKAIDSILADWSKKPENIKTCKLTKYIPSELPADLRYFLNNQYKIRLVGDRIFPIEKKKKSTDPRKVFKDDVYNLVGFMLKYVEKTYNIKLEIAYLNRHPNQVGVIKMFKNFDVDLDTLIAYSKADDNNKNVRYHVTRIPINETEEFKEYLQTLTDYC